MSHVFNIFHDYDKKRWDYYDAAVREVGIDNIIDVFQNPVGFGIRLTVSQAKAL
jgi:hypothetical protein